MASNNNNNNNNNCKTPKEARIFVGRRGGGGVVKGRLSRLRDKQQGDINIQLLQKGNWTFFFNAKAT